VSTPSHEAAVAVNDFIAQSGRFGVAVLDADGVVTERYGALVEHVEIGEDGDDAFPFLLGLEDDIEALRGSRGEHLHIPNMNVTLQDGRLVFASVFLSLGPSDDSTIVVLQDTTEASGTHRAMMQQRNDLDIARRQLEQVNAQLEERGIELDEARRRAEDATQEKSRFLAMMTHEIRTPMNGVLGMLQLIDDGTLESEKEQFAATARGSAESLLQIIGDILDFSKIEAGHLDIERIPFDLREVAHSVVLLLRPRAAEKGLSLETDLDERIPPAALGDPGRCRQILLNLIGNAIKFTSEGSVTLSVERQEAMGDDYRFAVSDTGIGISEEAQGRLFQEFAQSDASTTRRYGGTGLGLAISKRLVELMEGRIGLDSVEGSGSTFWFCLPLEETDQSPIRSDEAGTEEAIVGARILLADDALANRQVAVAMLGKAGYHIDTVVDGREAVEHGVAGDYDLVLMDLNMPEMDGMTAAAELRARGVRTPILAMTAHAESELGDLSDFDGHIGKPVRRGVLLDSVARAMTAAGVEVPAPSGEGAQDGPSVDASPAGHESGSEMGLDKDVLAGFLEDVGDESFGMLVDTYLAETRKRVEGLAEQGSLGAFDVVERFAHDIKSCAGTLGAIDLRDAAASLEHAAGRGEEETASNLIPTVVAAATTAYPLVEEARRALLP
jgi:signal transduction histidine kinase/HPt (histidine-containing phosphotransfer) domain-containing protein